VFGLFKCWFHAPAPLVLSNAASHRPENPALAYTDTRKQKAQPSGVG